MVRSGAGEAREAGAAVARCTLPVENILRTADLAPTSETKMETRSSLGGCSTTGPAFQAAGQRGHRAGRGRGHESTVRRLASHPRLLWSHSWARAGPRSRVSLGCARGAHDGVRVWARCPGPRESRR